MINLPFQLTTVERKVITSFNFNFLPISILSSTGRYGGREWSFGFGYGAGWCALLFLFMGAVLLVCDRDSEEIFYKERDPEAAGDQEDDDEEDEEDEEDE